MDGVLYVREHKRAHTQKITYTWCDTRLMLFSLFRQQQQKQYTKIKIENRNRNYGLCGHTETHACDLELCKRK